MIWVRMGFWPEGDRWSFLWAFQDRIPHNAKCRYLPGPLTEIVDVRGSALWVESDGTREGSTSPAEVVFIDLHPDANWAHPVAFALRYVKNGELIWLEHNLPPVSTASAIELVRLDNRFGVR